MRGGAISRSSQNFRLDLVSIFDFSRQTLIYGPAAPHSSPRTSNDQHQRGRYGSAVRAAVMEAAQHLPHQRAARQRHGLLACPAVRTPRPRPHLSLLLPPQTAVVKEVLRSRSASPTFRRWCSRCKTSLYCSPRAVAPSTRGSPAARYPAPFASDAAFMDLSSAPLLAPSAGQAATRTSVTRVCRPPAGTSTGVARAPARSMRWSAER